MSNKGNTGNKNNGYYNSGDYNSGDCNSGNKNSGDYNSGNCNNGNYNSGHYNSGHYNSGDCNSGKCNSGDYNIGCYNIGEYNSGDFNSGNYNSGHYNSGEYNSGNYNSGDCNTNTPTVRLFNKDSGLEFNGKIHNKLKNILYNLTKPLCEWVSESNMSDTEKQNNPDYKTLTGYLKVNKFMRNDIKISKEDEYFLRSLPNFDEAILLECTGIDLSNQKVKIVIDGKEIWISREAAIELKNNL